MNRSKRFSKSFVSGGLYDPNMPFNSQSSVNNEEIKEELQTVAANTGEMISTIKVEDSMKKSQNIRALDHETPIAQEGMLGATDIEMNSRGSKQVTSDTYSMIDENGKLKYKSFFGTRKKASVRAKEKRIRQNRRLRKTIIPKNALMALHEVKGLIISDFTINSNPNGGFTATVSVNDSIYEGQGVSKTAAKNNASEKALRDYIIAKMQQNPRVVKNGGTASTSGSICNDESMDDKMEESTEINEDKDDDTDDVPMVNLASFALFKLFSEWEKQGYSVPELHPARGNTSDNEGNDIIPKEIKKPPKRNNLPSNWQSMHPASLLCVMRPGVTYIDKGRTGAKGCEIQIMAVVVDDHEFVAGGRSKKTARHNVAAVVCNTLFNTNFVKVEPTF